jgi:type I restriction enzyme R subunit
MDESVVEGAALDWFAALGYAVMHGPDLGPGGIVAERRDYGQVTLEDRLRGALVRLNPTLPIEAVEDSLRRLTRPEGPTLETRNRAFHRMLVDGITVEYRRPDGSIAGAQARLLDFDDPSANAWMAINQFTVVEGQHDRRPDIVLFVNGLPLAVIELKNAAAEDATVWDAFAQLQT